MSGHADAAKIVQEFWEAFGNHDVEAAAALVDPDVVRKGPIPDPEEKDTCQGKESYVTFMNSALKISPTYRNETRKVFASDDGHVAILVKDWVCLKPGSDEMTTTDDFGLFHVNDKGLIDFVDWYWKQPDPELLSWLAAKDANAASAAS
jgi:predicted SnoaL-like aldol condensation-catalyzing enzyme